MLSCNSCKYWELEPYRENERETGLCTRIPSFVIDGYAPNEIAYHYGTGGMRTEEIERGIQHHKW